MFADDDKIAECREECIAAPMPLPKEDSVSSG